MLIMVLSEESIIIKRSTNPCSWKLNNFHRMLFYSRIDRAIPYITRPNHSLLDELIPISWIERYGWTGWTATSRYCTLSDLFFREFVNHEGNWDPMLCILHLKRRISTAIRTIGQENFQLHLDKFRKSMTRCSSRVRRSYRTLITIN